MLIKWIKEGNNCEKCKCLWESCDYWGECDCGCIIKNSLDWDEKPCRLPKVIRYLRLRKQNYYEKHSYDNYGIYIEEQEQRDEKCKKALKEMLSIYSLCIKNKDGTFRECDKENIIEQDAWKIRCACEPEHKKEKTLSKQWKEILKATILVIPNKIKPYILK